MDIRVHLLRIKKYKLIRKQFYDIKLHKNCFFYHKKIDLRSRLIYKHTNKINGKVYIGQCLQYEDMTYEQSMLYRWQGHCEAAFTKNSKYIFHKAIREFGPENFDHEVIDQYIPNQEEENEAEIYWIELYDSFVPNGYNMTTGGEGQSGFEHSQESIDLIINKQKGKKRPKWFCQNVSKGHKGIKQTPEHIENRISKLRGKKRPESILVKCRGHGDIHSKAVYKIDLLTKQIIDKFKSIKEASQVTKINGNMICACCKGKCMSAGKFNWEYVKSYDEILKLI